MFVNYAHRGASEYAPENTLSAFYLGLLQGANGIETDVQRTLDGELILFHDESLERVTNGRGSVCQHSWRHLSELIVAGKPTGQIQADRIVRLEDFLRHFGFRDLTFALELKQRNIEEDLLRMVLRFGMEDKCIFASFCRDDLENLRRLNAHIRLGYLTDQANLEVISFLQDISAEQICLKSSVVTPENVSKLNRMGFCVRAWGVKDEDTMRHLCQCGVDGGMTVNFPDKLSAYRRQHA